MPVIEINEQNYAILNAIMRHGFNFTVMINGSSAEPKTIDEVIKGLSVIADNEGYISMGWE